MQKLHIMIVFAALLVASGVYAAEGGQGGPPEGGAGGPKHPPRPAMEEVVLQHAQDLNLTADQQAKFQAALDAKKAAMDSLTPEQREKLRQFLPPPPPRPPKDGAAQGTHGPHPPPPDKPAE